MKAFLQSARLLFALPLLAATVLVSVSCKKQQQDKSQTIPLNSPLVKDAMAYFSTLAVKKADPVRAPVALKKAIPKVISRQPVNRFAQIGQTIDWKGGFQQQQDGVTYLFVPVKEGITLPSNNAYQFFRYLIFSEPASSGITVTVVEVLGDKGYSFESDKGQIATRVFNNELDGKSLNIGAANASVFFYDNAYKQTASFKLSKGEWTVARISFRSDLAIRQ